MRGRPELVTSYASDQAILNTPAKRWSLGLLLAAALVLPFMLDRELNVLFASAYAYAIGAIGLNLLSGYAGQVSLGHAFFFGIGAYTAAVISGDPDGRVWGLGIDNILIWLPLAGLVPAAVGWLIAPVATRLRGLYLGIVTLGLVFLGEHLFRELVEVTGGSGIGRDAAEPSLFGFRFDARDAVFGVELDRGARYHILALVLLVIMGTLGRNIARSRAGRAFSAVRDRDIAAEVMGVDLAATKRAAFTISSFYAGISGALISTFIGRIAVAQFGLLLSILFIAMVLIGGAATISGSIMGAMFIVLLPRFVNVVPEYLPFIEPSATGGFLNTSQLEQILYGGLIIVFLILEPRGLFGVWLRVRNYWKAFPFSY